MRSFFLYYVDDIIMDYNFYFFIIYYFWPNNPNPNLPSSLSSSSSVMWSWWAGILRTDNHEEDFPRSTTGLCNVVVIVVECRYSGNMFKHVLFYTLLIAKCVRSMRWEEVEVRHVPT